MTWRFWSLMGLLWVLSLLAVGTAASAQMRVWRPVPEPKVLFGEDVGFRVDGFRGEIPSGTIVIRVNGAWVEAQIGGPGELLK